MRPSKSHIEAISWSIEGVEESNRTTFQCYLVRLLRLFLLLSYIICPIDVVPVIKSVLGASKRIKNPDLELAGHSHRIILTMAANYGSDSDSLSSSSSSDDDFLTIKSGKGARNEDREALVRKKLLESFYGASAVQQQEEAEASSAKPSALQRKQETELNASHDEDDEEEDEEQRKQRSSKDLDSPYFAHETFIRDQVIGSSVHDLLETEERLALQVRTLDSTMQTLVYENYSKFIDATDAIKSIGVSCSANEDGLAKLSRGMQTIDEQSKEVEDALGSLRDAVAEKLRVKRLLTRLDALLKLPSTLQSQIQAGKFRLATKSYLAAHSILSKHSTGFESLKTIEIDCHSILTDMVLELKRKLTHWSGRFAISSDDMQDEDADDWVPPPEPPKTMSEIFEAAGTLAFATASRGYERSGTSLI